MTSITKDELMQMARQAGFQTGSLDLFNGAGAIPIIRPIGESCEIAITKLINIVLERAAVEIEPTHPRGDWTEYAENMYEFACDIRALKINTGD